MDGGGEQTSVAACRVCASPLAHDQRYCLECGTRRNSPPPYIAQALGRIREQGGAVGERPSVAATAAVREAGGAGAADPLPQEAAGADRPTRDADGADRPTRDAGPFDAWLGAPRAAAVAVLGMLGFGALLGSLVGESGANGTQQIIVAVTPHTSPHTSALGAAGSGGLGGAAAAAAAAGGGGGGGTQTITVGSGGTEIVTTPASGSSNAAAANSSSASSTAGGGSTTGRTLPPIKHVFMITLSDEGYNETFGHSADDPYLAKTLVAKGELVPDYYAVAGGSLANEIALVSGQGPTPDTINNCPRYTNVVPGNRGAKGQILGNGCVYPKETQTLADQLTAAKLTWRAYVQVTGTDNEGRREACRHPQFGSPNLVSSLDPVAPWQNPFHYFHSLIDKSACPANDIPLAQLTTDLKTPKTTPTLSYVVPNLCDDGSETPCGAPNASPGMVAADTFLKAVVPEIERSPAYKADGLILITFDQAPQTGPNADQSSCCDNPTYPNLPPPPTSTGTTPMTTDTTTTPTLSTSPLATTVTTTSPGTTTPTTTSPGTTTPTTPALSLGSGQSNPTGGGGQVGLLLISRYVKPGTLDVTDYFNHFSLLASVENLLGLKRLGYASDPVLPVFGTAVYSNYAAG